MVNFDAAIKRPFQDFKKVAVGATISIFTVILLVMVITVSVVGSLFSMPNWNPILFIFIFVAVLFITMAISFFITGYGYECAKTAMNKQSELPEWKDWGKLWMKGFYGFILMLVYSIPFFFFSAIIGILISVLASSSIITKTILLLILILTVLLIFSYITPMALMFFIDKWNIENAFRIKEIFRKAFTRKYLAAWSIVFTYSLSISVIFNYLLKITQEMLIITLILYLIYIFLNIAVIITSMTVYGEVYSEIK
ncbi:MAG: DUF4013 domain-containing protein [Candidatus Nanoarchaeia archaeon]|nr:DUF4013 domain-containing protein [Candidatus Nanoarchaeia archaeon]